MQQIVTKIIVLAAVALLAWLLYRKLRRKNAGCSASGCNECGQPCCGPRSCDSPTASKESRHAPLFRGAADVARKTDDRHSASR